MAEKRAEEEKKELEKEKKEIEKVEKAVEAGAESLLYMCAQRYYVKFLDSDDTRVSKLHAEAEALAQKKNDIIEKEERKNATMQELEKEKKAVEEALREEQKKKQIVEFVKKKGSDSQKKRLVANLLPHSEIINLIEKDTFKSLKKFTKYAFMQKSDVCECEYETCHVVFENYEADEATETEFEKLEEIKKLMPAAEVSLKKHEGTAYDCGEVLQKKSIVVKISAGAFSFKREFEV